MEVENAALIVDGSTETTDRLGDVQRTIYDFRKGHCFEFLALVSPNGINVCIKDTFETFGEYKMFQSLWILQI